jgi:hypothetical protein
MVLDVTEAAGIFTGRGGSGTRLLSELAAAAGTFIGNDVNKMGDSVEWVDLIYRMVVEAGGQRELPTGSRYRRDIRAKVLSHAPPGRSRWWVSSFPKRLRAGETGDGRMHRRGRQREGSLDSGLGLGRQAGQWGGRLRH